MKLTERQKQVISIIMARYQEEGMEAKFKALDQAVDKAFLEGEIHQSDIDSLFGDCGLCWDNFRPVALLFGL